MFKEATIISLAWPDTKVVKEGKWYDVPMTWIGAIKNNHYSVGHAAFLLINHADGLVHYFDFGRYHTPLKHGRVRDKHTDPDIEVKQKALFREGEIDNLHQILKEVAGNKSTHGSGRMTASIVKGIDFTKAWNKVKSVQDREAVPYGPFQFKGSTCSRLVAQVILFSTKNWLTKLLIRVPYTVSATPKSNLKILNDYSFYYEIINKEIEVKKSKLYAFKRLFVWKYRAYTPDFSFSVSFERDFSEPI